MYKYLLVWQYHDDNFQLFNEIEHLKIFLNKLKWNYKNDNDFKYQVFKVRELKF